MVGVVLAAGRTLDGPLDVVLRHVGLARGQDGATQARILVRLRQARLGRDHDFLGQPRKLLGALLILRALARSEEHTSELQSLMRISYAVFCLKKKTTINNNITYTPYKLLSDCTPMISYHKYKT